MANTGSLYTTPNSTIGLTGALDTTGDAPRLFNPNGAAFVFRARGVSGTITLWRTTDQVDLAADVVNRDYMTVGGDQPYVFSNDVCEIIGEIQVGAKWGVSIVGTATFYDFAQ